MEFWATFLSSFKCLMHDDHFDHEDHQFPPLVHALENDALKKRKTNMLKSRRGDAAKSPLGGNFDFGVQKNIFNAYGGRASEPILQCPCGAGPCSVWTARTWKNYGRKFYRCPRKQGYGQCTIFRWCDELT